MLDECAGQRLDGISAMRIDHAIAECVVSGGVRRSARMAIMHWADRQIHEFVTIKQSSGSHWTTNISVEVDKQFWRRLQAPAGSVEHEQAQAVLDAMATGMVHNGEPGFWDSGQSNDGEPNPVVATNPCGEIPLTPWENCNLGHVNLAAFLDEQGNIDWIELLQAHELMTRFLIRATYGDVTDPKQAQVLASNRRIGVGHFGVASYLAMSGVKYSEAHHDEGFIDLLERLADTVDEAAAHYCHNLRIPVPVKKRTVAPTGTIAKMPGVSEGIHPIFSQYFIRRIRLSRLDPDQARMLESYVAKGYTVEDDLYAANTTVVSIATKDILMQQVEDIHGAGCAQDIVECAADLTLEQMLQFQALYQTHWADNAVSFTANIDPNTYTPADVAGVIRKFGLFGLLKGATIFPESSIPQSPYQRISKQQFDNAVQQAIEDGTDPDSCVHGCPIR